MSSESGTTKRCSTRKNTSFKESASRRVDEFNQVIFCDKCKFVAPISLSFECYIELHDRFCNIVKNNCSAVESLDDVYCKLIKCKDFDKTWM
ncbi:hypothetical protein KM622_gp103 [Spodoptera exempta nucleopolyhedrovirus]|uniref:Uncharacterized protein n=1 Tax=Spodoptera exempta nucleopolyhedrovirus TaxID=1242863 RepID=A0A410S7V4_9ABAC|nr:hypothetical protein KM622_gp103 [Spodoptera exempta nucleopolyhedrovirus]QAT90389.1 hypothetical protein [Spodoptera exempta nucleopolyhedrovirus]